MERSSDLSADGLSLERFFLQSTDGPQRLKAGILLAISGGADSVAMCRCFAALSEQTSTLDAAIQVAHVNHALRGGESDGDAVFVRELADRFCFAYHETRLTPEMFNVDDSGSFEAAARKLRYDFLQRTAEQNSLRYVALAHNADDQAETILHRILRGTGIAGLAGIPPFRPLGEAVTIIRPMLSFSKKQILDYLAAIDQPFRTDSSNAESRYTRNKIRNDLLPQLASGYNHNVVEALVRLGSQAADWAAYIRSQTDALFDRAVIVQSHKTLVQVEQLADVPNFLIRELFVMIWSRQHWHLRDMTFAHWERLAEMITSHTQIPQKQAFPGNIAAERTDAQLILYKSKQATE